MPQPRVKDTTVIEFIALFSNLYWRFSVHLILLKYLPCNPVVHQLLQWNSPRLSCRLVFWPSEPGRGNLWISCQCTNSALLKPTTQVNSSLQIILLVRDRWEMYIIDIFTTSQLLIHYVQHSLSWSICKTITKTSFQSKKKHHLTTTRQYLWDIIKQ